MQAKPFRRLLVAGALALLALPMVAAPASADQAFHTLHADVVPVGSAPLKSGFVNDIHTNGVQTERTSATPSTARFLTRRFR